MGVIVYVPVQIGCDPELFLVDTTSGRIVGAEEVIPAEGLDAGSGRGKIVRDGIQLELHPHASTCRENVASYLATAFQTLEAYLKTSFPHVGVSFAGNVDVSPETFEKCPSGRELGCMPSKNIHNPVSDLGVDGTTYMKRSAGGHFHFGLKHINIYAHEPEAARLKQYVQTLYAQRESLVPLFDILMGNQGVLLDRDPLAAERRKVYGRAGEYRLPDHGIEYRTLSNFWLRSYQLFGLMAGLGRTAVAALWTDLNAGYVLADHSRPNSIQGDATKVSIPATSNLVGDLLNSVDINAVIHAINHNDFDLAWQNWQQIKLWLQENVHFTEDNYAFPLNVTTIPAFEQIVQDGVDKWFFEDPLQHWCAGYVQHLAHNGWERFTSKTMKYVQEWAKVREAA